MKTEKKQSLDAIFFSLICLMDYIISGFKNTRITGYVPTTIKEVLNNL